MNSSGSRRTPGYHPYSRTSTTPSFSNGPYPNAVGSSSYIQPAATSSINPYGAMTTQSQQGSSAAARYAGGTLKRSKTLQPTKPERTSTRLRERAKEEIDKLMKEALALLPKELRQPGVGASGTFSATALMLRGLVPGLRKQDNRVSDRTKAELKQLLADSIEFIPGTVPLVLQQLGVEPLVQGCYAGLMNDPNRTGGVNPFYKMSTRRPDDHWISGMDVTITRNDGRQLPFTRLTSDTPNPSSAPPTSGDDSSGDERSKTRGKKIKKDMPYHRAHQAPFALTGVPGSTVNAPAPANLILDKTHELRVTKTVGSLLVRVDTFSRSQLYSLVPAQDDSGQQGWEVCQCSYERRSLAAESDSEDDQQPASPSKRTGPSRLWQTFADAPTDAGHDGDYSDS